MLTVLGALGEFERDLTRARTSEDSEHAKARGVKLGRRPAREIACSYNVSHSMISRLTAGAPYRDQT
jgi:DNA invertase Pin-like site-specific DNA recombinase